MISPPTVHRVTGASRKKLKPASMTNISANTGLSFALSWLSSSREKAIGYIFWVRDFHRWGYPDWFRIVVGIAELTSMVLLLVPRFAGYGASLFVVVMLGAIYTHATHNESSRLPFNLFLLALSLIIAFTRRPNFLQKL